jgi:hypothetical protein
MKKMMQRDTEQFIDTLSENLQPVRGIWNPLWRTLIYFLCGLTYIGVSVALLGLRSDIISALNTHVFVFEIGLAMLIAFTAAMASMWMALPDRGGWWHVHIVPLTLLGAFCFWVVVQPLGRESGAIGTHYWAHCLLNSLIFIFIPLTIMLIINMRARTTTPLATCAINVLSISALGWCGLRLTCPIDTIGHGIIYHMLPYAGFAIIAAFAARRLFRW